MILWISKILVPFTICYIIGFGLISKRPVWEDFLFGASEGIKTVIHMLPTLIGLMIAVGIFHSSGLLDQVTWFVKIPAEFLKIPADILPIALIRMISNSAATGLLLDLFKKYGADSNPGIMASVMLSSTESMLYCISVYCGSIHISKTRYTILGALIATAAGIAASIFFCEYM